MSLIFDAFPTLDNARDFVTAVQQQFGLEGQVFATTAEANAHDPFLFELTPPIVHIDRGRDQGGVWVDATADIEAQIEVRANNFAGRFAGT